ncbi:MAG: hypothetical protein ACRDVE_07385 [Actinocrinis sp.]
MFRPLRALRLRTEADDARMREDGFEVLATGRYSRTYKLAPEQIARRRREADDEHIRRMAARCRETYALAFPAEHAAQLARAAGTRPAPAAAPLPLDQLAAALAQHGARIVFERLTIDNPPPGGQR